MTSPSEHSRPGWIRRSDPWLWSALAVAFSPLWLDWLRHGLDRPWARYSLLFVPIATAAAWRAPRVRPRPWMLSLVGLALVIELAALAWGAPQRGRLALPLAWVSACAAFGTAPPSVALLAIFWVPVPSLVFKWTSPELEHAQLALVVPALSALGLDLAREAAWAVSGPERLAVTRFDAGWNTLALAGGLGAWVAVSRSATVRRPCADAGSGPAGARAVAPLLAPVVAALALGALAQLGLLAAACAVLAFGGEPGARAILTHGWAGVAVGGGLLAVAAQRPRAHGSGALHG